MVAAAKIGWVTRNYFSTKRKYFYPAILLLSVLLAAGDIMAATLLCLPLFALYESGILIIKLFTGKSENKDALSSDPDNNV